ncbi:YhbY family RNA-binding protein [Agarilytica rhodophyticola]|uniref:YhbY family RNA-binding protein n=1 Tax=Agarilytica rhodophyticola TaxID=1737490 RepID=UPI000B349888|nr:YhbY family RNA-binding protein [Agarilytica rhodophyticola]
MSMSNESKKHYRLIGHNLKPVVTVAGKGLTDSVVAEIDRALGDHELIKAKIAITDRDIRKQVVAEICNQLNAENVQEIGKVVLLFRASDKPTLKTSNIRQ